VRICQDEVWPFVDWNVIGALVFVVFTPWGSAGFFCFCSRIWVQTLIVAEDGTKVVSFDEISCFFNSNKIPAPALFSALIWGETSLLVELSFCVLVRLYYSVRYIWSWPHLERDCEASPLDGFAFIRYWGHQFWLLWLRSLTLFSKSNCWLKNGEREKSAFKPK